MIFCFTDPHLDRGDGGFSVNGNHQAFSDFLDLVGKEPLISLGDTLELWANSYSEIMGGPNADLIKRLAEHSDFTCLVGNHDLNPGLLQHTFPKAKICFGLKVEDWHLLHGYQVDPLLRGAWARWFVSKGDFVLTHLTGPLLAEYSDWSGHQAALNGEMMKGLEFQEEKGRKYLCGHSHNWVLDPPDVDKAWYMNAGAFCITKPTYAVIDDQGPKVYPWGKA